MALTVLDWIVPVTSVASTVFAGWAAFAASKAAGAANSQARLTEKQLISDQRAWMATDLIVRGGLEYNEKISEYRLVSEMKILERHPILRFGLI